MLSFKRLGSLSFRSRPMAVDVSSIFFPNAAPDGCGDESPFHFQWARDLWCVKVFDTNSLIQSRFDFPDNDQPTVSASAPVDLLMTVTLWCFFPPCWSLDSLMQDRRTTFCSCTRHRVSPLCVIRMLLQDHASLSHNHPHARTNPCRAS